jgi:hypothetical protein
MIREVANADRIAYEMAEYEAATAALRSVMEPGLVEAAWAAGRSMTIDAAVNFALRSPGA